MGPVEVSQAAKQIWRFGSQLSRGVWGSPAIFDVIPTTLPREVASLEPKDEPSAGADAALTLTDGSKVPWTKVTSVTRRQSHHHGERGR
jgi:hypothetical protein